jgi:hypothetical protein
MCDEYIIIIIIIIIVMIIIIIIIISITRTNIIYCSWLMYSQIIGVFIIKF